MTKPRRYKADTIASMLDVDFATRQRLQLWTIGATDLDANQRRERRRELDRRAKEQKRRSAGIPPRKSKIGTVWF